MQGTIPSIAMNNEEQSRSLLEPELAANLTAIVQMHKANVLYNANPEDLVERLARREIFPEEDFEAFPGLLSDEGWELEDALQDMVNNYALSVELHDGGDMDWYNPTDPPHGAEGLYCRIMITCGGPDIYVLTSEEEPKPVLLGIWGGARIIIEAQNAVHEDALTWFYEYFAETAKAYLEATQEARDRKPLLDLAECIAARQSQRGI